MTRLLLLFIPFFLLSACAREITQRSFPSADIIPNKSEYTLNLNKGAAPLRILYLGCGHLAMEYRNEIVLTDPFFSTQGLLQKKIRTSEETFNKYKQVLRKNHFDLSKTTSVWIAHTHYDHMMDLPLLLHHALPPQAILYGNEYGDDILANFLAPGQYHALAANETYDPESKSVDNDSRWIQGSSSLRVLPIVSNHAPHFKIGPVPIHMMKGKIDPAYFRENLRDAFDTTKRGKWKEGSTYSFLIDFMNGPDIAYRIFVQTSSSDYPLGKPPDNLPDERPVDVAFLCLASSNYVKPYPVDILKALNAKKVVFIHWEDFFLKTLDFDHARLVRATGFRKIHRRLERHHIPLDTTRYVMPRPGTLLHIQ